MVPTTLRTVSMAFCTYSYWTASFFLKKEDNSFFFLNTGNYYIINFLKVLLTELANEYDNSKHFNISGPKKTGTGVIKAFYIQ